jgi:uncharacterized protein with von Willebrand factor type A (vWA) domain
VLEPGRTSDPERIAVGFAAALRAIGLAVPTGSVVAFLQALGALGIGSRDAVYWAGRATLVRRGEDVPSYDEVFDAYWLRLPPDAAEVAEPETVTVGFDDDSSEGDGPSGDDEEPSTPTVTVRWSPAEVLRRRDFAAYSAADWAEAERLIAALRVGGARRRARRYRPARHDRRRVDLRRTVRAALRTGGTPMDRAWVAPTWRPRRIVLVVDVSGSMEPYARALLRFAHAAVHGRRGCQVEVFTLGTRLTRVTRELSRRDADAALSDAAAAVEDWSGGTRLGGGLEEFNDRWGTRGLARGAVVVILSDGWDRGDPELLGSEMARLSRVAWRVVWVNPLKSSPGYEPLARGMAAALPFVDQFVEGHSVESLEHLARVVAGPGDDDRSRRGAGR